MAIVQISRIQNRRGKKNTGSGIPQLASGELGWAIDAQELYIGNGAVSEGAPTVGNTRLLTEKDDLLELAGQYAYKRDINFLTGSDASSPVERTIQSKLDDVVSVKDFGANGDGTDQTVQIQRAIDQLFINSATKGLYSSRVTLRIPAGEYLITDTLYVPPFANIVGDGKGKTYLNASGDVPPQNVFRTVNETSTPGLPADDSTSDSINQARQITIKGLTILHHGYGGTLRLDSCRDSHFEDIEFIGQWATGNGVDVDYTAIKLNALSTAVSSNNNLFLNCSFSGFVYPVFSDWDVYHNKFINGTVDIAGYGFVFGLNTVIGDVGQATGPSHTVIENYDFLNIDRQGIIVDNGRYNTSTNNRFIAVGNDGGNSSSAAHSIIRFGDRSNISNNDYFERTADLTVDPLYLGQTYPAEVEGPKDYTNNFEVSTPIGANIDVTPIVFMELPADQNKGMIEVNYHYRAELTNAVVRKGKMTIIFDKVNGDEVSLNDEYTAIGNPVRADALVFTADLSAAKIVLKMTNSSFIDGDPEVDEFVFTVRHIA